MKPLAHEVWGFAVHPAVFFRTRLQKKPNWVLALSAPALCALLQLASALVLSEKAQPVLREFLVQENLAAADMHAFSTVAASAGFASYFLNYGMMALAVVCLDVLLKDSGRLPRLAEFTGLSFFLQLPYCVLMLIAAYLWVPDPVLLPTSTSPSEIRLAIQEWRQVMFSWPLFVASRTIAYYLLAWQAILLAICLKIVSGLSTRAVLLAGGLLLALSALVQSIGPGR